MNKTIVSIVCNEKEVYLQPDIKVRSLELTEMIANSIGSVNGDGDGSTNSDDTGIGYGGSGDGPAYVKPYNIWDEWE